MKESQEKVLESSALHIPTEKIADRIVIKDSENVHLGNVINIHQPSPSSSDKNDSESFQIQREFLMNYYKTKNAYMKSLLWSERNNDFPLKDYFIELTVQEADLLGRKAGETIQFTQIFPKLIDRHVVMLVTGDPGYGKTTFCKKIAYDWGTNTSRTNYLGHYDFTVVIILRELEKKSITNEILQCICENTDSNSRDKLRQKGFNLLIILDGFDETADKDSIIQFIRKDSFRISKEMTILVTCRPHAAENIREEVNLRFVVQGFSQEQKEKYIRLIVNGDNRRQDELLNLIKFSNFHSALAECPLMLHMLCCLPQTKYFHKIRTKTDLFIQIFRLVIKRYIRKTGEKHNLIKGKFFYGEDLLVKLGEIYLEKRSKMNKIDKHISMYDFQKLLTLTDKQLKKKFPENKDYKFILGLDIFAKYFEVDGNNCFDFIHGSFLDFIMALSCYHSIKTAGDYVDDYMILPFLSGLCGGDDEFSDSFIHTIQQNVHYPSIWLECVKEIKDITNKQSFCSNTKVYFDFTCLKMMKIAFELPFFQLSRIYFHFPSTKHLYEETRKNLIDLHNIYKRSDKLEIFLFLDRVIPLVEEGNSFESETLSEKIYNIRQSVGLIQNLINNFKWDKFKIYINGIFVQRSINPILHYNEYNFFKDVEKPATIPKCLKQKLHKTSKHLVALLSNDAFVGEVKYLISTEQYSSLKDNIKISSNDE